MKTDHLVGFFIPGENMSLNIGRGRTVQPTKAERDFFTVDLKRKAHEDDTLAQIGLLMLHKLGQIEETLDAIADRKEAEALQESLKNLGETIQQ